MNTGTNSHPHNGIDAIVLGAGLAGLAAAHALCAAGKSVLVLEARARAGGRVFTHRDPTTTFPIELGPEWVGSEGEMHALLKRVGADLRVMGGPHVVRRNGALTKRNADSGMGEVFMLLGQLLSDGVDRTLLAALDQCCGDAKHEEGRRALLSYVQGFHTANPATVSTQWLLQVEENEPADASQYHALAGLDSAAHALEAELGAGSLVQYNAAVKQVVWSDAGVEVHAACADGSQMFTAPRLICALPLSILKLPAHEVGAVQFSPPLQAKQAALQLLDTGHATKIVLVFSEPFWMDLEGLSHASFIQEVGLPLPTWWTTYPVRAPVITGWVGGPLAEPLMHLKGEDLLELAVDSLASVLGVTRARVLQQLKGWHTHDWSADPFARGAYSYVLCGGSGAQLELAQPLRNTLFFAGEATCGLGHNATMEGALQSGKRAAQELLACL